MKLRKRNKARVIVALIISGIYFTIVYMPALAVVLLISAWLWGVVEFALFVLEDFFGFDFSDE